MQAFDQIIEEPEEVKELISVVGNLRPNRKKSTEICLKCNNCDKIVKRKPAGRPDAKKVGEIVIYKSTC